MKSWNTFARLATIVAVVSSLSSLAAKGSSDSRQVRSSRQYIAQPAEASAIEANPFAGAYAGYIGNLSGSAVISDGGNVSGSFSFWSPFYRDNVSFTGTVTADGFMRLKVVRTITVRDRRTSTSTTRYSATLTVALDESGSLVGISGWATPFVWSPYQ